MLTPTSPNQRGEVSSHQVGHVDRWRGLLQWLMGSRGRKWVALLACVAFVPLLQGCALIETLGEAFGSYAEQICVPELTVTRPDDSNDDFCTAEDCSLREAIFAANVCPGRQTIVLPTDTYSVASAFLEISDDLTILGGGSTVRFPLGPTSREIFSLTSVEISSLTSVEISSLTFTEMSYPIHNAGLLTLSNVVFANNDTRFEIVDNRDRLTLVNSTFTDNIADKMITNYGTLTFQGGEVARNIMHGYGAMVYNTGAMTLREVEFAGNLRLPYGCPELLGPTDESLIFNYRLGTLTADDIILRGAAPTASMPACTALIDWGINNDGEARVLRSTITGFEERAVWNYGQLEILDSWLVDNPGEALTNHGAVRISNSTISGNGLVLRDSSFHSPCGPVVNRGLMVIENSTISGNSAIGLAGLACQAIANEGELHLAFVTLVYNELTGIGTGDGPALTTLRSSIVVGNAPQNCIGTENGSEGYNLFGDDTCPADLTLEDQVLSTGQDPLLGPLADNGGPTLTHALLLGSPALDHGGPVPPCTSIDQRYRPRPRNVFGSPAACDVGAYESDLGLASATIVAATSEPETLMPTPTSSATLPLSTPTRLPTPPVATLPPTAPVQPSATAVAPNPTDTPKPTDTPIPPTAPVQPSATPVPPKP